MVEEQMRAQREQTEAAMSAARERSTAERERYSRQQRELQAQIETARRKQQEQERTINSLRERLRRMWYCNTNSQFCCKDMCRPDISYYNCSWKCIIWPYSENIYMANAKNIEAVWVKTGRCNMFITYVAGLLDDLYAAVKRKRGETNALKIHKLWLQIGEL